MALKEHLHPVVVNICYYQLPLSVHSHSIGTLELPWPAAFAPDAGVGASAGDDADLGADTGADNSANNGKTGVRGR